MRAINENHFGGHRNLNVGERAGTDSILEEFLDELQTTAVADEAEFQARADYPRVDGFTGAAAGVKLDGSVNFVLAGDDFLQAQTFASRLIGTKLELYAVVPGVAGNLERVVVIDSEAGGLAVTYADHLLTIDLGGSTSHADDVATAINALADCHGIIRATQTAGSTTVIVETAEVQFTGGTGTGFAVTIGGQPATILHDTGATSVANITETAVTLVPHDLSTHGFVAGNAVAVYMTSNSKMSMPLVATLIA